MIAPNIDKNLSFHESFNFVDNPVMLVVSMPSYGVTGGSMYQVVVELYLIEQEEAAYTFKLETHIGGTVYIDLSSALRAHLNILDYDADSVNESKETLTYTQARFYAKVYFSYLRDGAVVNDTDSAVYHPQNGGAGYYAYAYHGGIADFDRMILSLHPGLDADDSGDGVQNTNPNYWAKNIKFSLKPSSVESWGVGDIVLNSEFYDGLLGEGDWSIYYRGPKTTASVVSAADNPSLPADHFHFLFVNSLGVFETVSAVAKDSLYYEMKETEALSMGSYPSYRSVPDRMTFRQPARATWKMSSGYTTKEWADWWINEFFMAKKHWLRMEVDEIVVQTDENDEKSFVKVRSKKWIPCVVIPEDEEPLIYDKVESRMPHVNFTVQLAVTGSVINHLSVNL